MGGLWGDQFYIRKGNGISWYIILWLDISLFTFHNILMWASLGKCFWCWSAGGTTSHTLHSWSNCSHSLLTNESGVFVVCFTQATPRIYKIIVHDFTRPFPGRHNLPHNMLRFSSKNNVLGGLLVPGESVSVPKTSTDCPRNCRL